MNKTILIQAPTCRFIQAQAAFSILCSDANRSSTAIQKLKAFRRHLWVSSLHCIEVEITRQHINQIQARFTFAEIKDADGYLTARTGDAQLKQMIQNALKAEWEAHSATDDARLNGVIVYQIERNPIPGRLFDDYQAWLRDLARPTRVPGDPPQRRRKLRRVIRIH